MAGAKQMSFCGAGMRLSRSDQVARRAKRGALRSKVARGRARTLTIGVFTHALPLKTPKSQHQTSNIKLQTLTLYTAKIFLAFCALALSGCVSLDLASAAKLASALKMDFFPDLRPQESHELIKKLPNMV